MARKSTAEHVPSAGVEMEAFNVLNDLTGAADAVVEWEPSHDDNFNMMLIVDAINRESAFYYVAEDGHVESIWEKGDDALLWAVRLRSKTQTRMLSCLALLDMLLSVFSPPGIQGTGKGVMYAAEALQIIIWALFVVLISIRLRFMWSNRVNWFKGSSEPYWLCMQAFVLFIITPVEMLDRFFFTGDRSLLQASGATIRCPAYLAVFLQGWSRAYHFIYFNQGVRDALRTLLQVVQTLLTLHPKHLLMPRSVTCAGVLP